MNIKLCTECNQRPVTKRSGRFCSQPCAARWVGKRNTKGRGTGWHHSEETKALMGVIRKRHLATDEGRQRHLDSMKTRRPVTDETRANMSAAAKRRWARRGEDWDRQIKHLKHIQSPTRIEEILVNIVLAEFPDVQREVQFGRYRVDAYLPPPYHLAFEADGVYWHRESTSDAKRDAYLLAEHGLVVVRLGEQELLSLA